MPWCGSGEWHQLYNGVYPLYTDWNRHHGKLNASYYSFPLITGQKVRPTDLILNQLVFANNFVLFRRIPQIVSAFGWKNFLSDTECHTHAFWVASGPPSFVPHSFGVSNPGKDAHGVLVYGLYFWILQLVMNIYIFVWVTGQRLSQNMIMNII